MASAEKLKANIKKVFPEAAKHPKINEMLANSGRILQIVFTDMDYAFHIDCIGQPKFVEGAHEKPTAVIKGTSETWDKLLSGKMSGMKAFMTGKLKIEGSWRDLIKLQPLQSIAKDLWDKQ